MWIYIQQRATAVMASGGSEPSALGCGCNQMASTLVSHAKALSSTGFLCFTLNDARLTLKAQWTSHREQTICADLTVYAESSR